MPSQFDEEFFNLLMKHFGEEWSHQWTAEDGGFHLKLQVWGIEEQDND